MPSQLKRFVKSHINRLAIALFVYELIFQLGSAVLLLAGTGLFQNEYFAMILCSALALLSVYLILGRPEPVPAPAGRFSPLKYLWLLLLFYGMQLLAICLTLPVERLFRGLGFSLEQAAEAAGGGRLSDPLMLFYTVLFAPLFEELLFRCYLYGSLRRFGRSFAVFSTAFLFALMHGNILQFLAAFLIGLLLAGIRERWGLRYAILLHLSNNALAILFNNYTENAAPVYGLYLFLLFGGTAALLLTVLRSFRPWREQLRQEQSLRSMLGCFFSSVCMLILILCFLALAALNLN